MVSSFLFPRAATTLHRHILHRGFCSLQRDGIMVDPHSVGQQIATPNNKLCIVDCGTQDEYDRAHIPGAQRLPFDKLLKCAQNPTTMVSSEHFKDIAEKLGITQNSTVIAYDGSVGMYASRLWWVLHHYGHRNVRMLDGGWKRWLDERLPVSNETSRSPANVADDPFNPVSTGSLLADKSFVLKAVENIPTRAHHNESILLLDARTPEEYMGTGGPANPRGGHIPGAHHINFTSFLQTSPVSGGPTSVLKREPELRELLTRAGLPAEDDGRPIVTYCQRGVRAAHAGVVLKLLGFKDIRVYEGSMQEWSADPSLPMRCP